MEGTGCSNNGIKYDSLKFLYIINKISQNNGAIKASDLEKALIKIENITPLIETLDGLKPTYLPYILQEYIITSVLESKDAVYHAKGHLRLNPEGKITVLQAGKEYIANKLKGINKDFKKYADEQIKNLNL
jgi:hypothetical protein